MICAALTAPLDLTHRYGGSFESNSCNRALTESIFFYDRYYLRLDSKHKASRKLLIGKLMLPKGSSGSVINIGLVNSIGHLSAADIKTLREVVADVIG